MERMDEVAVLKDISRKTLTLATQVAAESCNVTSTYKQLRHVPLLFVTFLICLRVAFERIRIRE